jgi:signal transduction histidine kinase
MFRKLKLQFILTNLAIISVLFITLTAGVYFVLQINMMNHARVLAKRIVEGINSGFFPEFPRGPQGRPPHFNGPPPMNRHPMPEPERFRPPLNLPRDNQRIMPPFFYIKTNSKQHIVFQSPEQPFTKHQLKILVDRAYQTGKNSGQINFHHSNYFFYKAKLKKTADKLPGMILFFLNLKQDKMIQQTMVLSLLTIGLIYLMLALTGSLFMAKRAILPIQKAWQQQKDFLADASHELRTPLTVIQTNLEVVLRNPGETVASQMDWLVNVREELDQMTGLVSSLLFLTRMDSGSYPMEKTNFSLDKVATGVSEAFNPLATAKNIVLSTSIPEKIDYYGDESNIRRVMEILLDNAIQYTPDYGKISLRLQLTDKKILLEISDTGEGIAAEHLPKIFDRFYQVDPSRSKGKAGLGLPIAKSIIENHNGTIQVTSQPGMGTTFSIWLPLI